MGPDRILMICARTEEALFWALFLETSPPGGPKAPETMEKMFLLHLRVAMLDMLIPTGKLTFTLPETLF